MFASTYGRLQQTVRPKHLHTRLRGRGANTSQGLYEQQDDEQIDHNLRGKFYTDSDGGYAFYCIRPTPYPVPSDGPAGKLLQLMDRHPFRPAHIHFIVSATFFRATNLGSNGANTPSQALAEGYKPITTQIFDRQSKYLDDDSVFAVKESLIVDFVPTVDKDHAASSTVEYNVLLVRVESSI
jgi:catechol 1,2-dioxygenase